MFGHGGTSLSNISLSDVLDMPRAFGLLGIDFAYGFDNVDLTQSTPNGWETHFIIGQQF